MRLGRVKVSGGFLLLLAWLNYTDTQGLIPLAVLSCALHEAGHWLAIQAVGGEVTGLRLGIAGAAMELGRPLSYGAEILCALAGPGVSLALSWVGSILPGGALLAGINLVLAAFNLLPVSGLDGGRALHCALCALAGPEAAERACWTAFWWVRWWPEGQFWPGRGAASPFFSPLGGFFLRFGGKRKEKGLVRLHRNE